VTRVGGGRRLEARASFQDVFGSMAGYWVATRWAIGLRLGELEMVFKTEITRACLDYIQTSVRKITVWQRTKR
jgi:hypothetical protein